MAVVAEQAAGLDTSPRAAARRRQLFVDLAVGLGLFLLALTLLLRAVETVPFHGDESEWINAGRYFKFVFLDRDVTSSVWRPSWLNRDQPPIGRYVIGGIIWASGSNPSQVNRSYAWEKDYTANLEEGRVPGPKLLVPVRRTMAVLGALSIVLLFLAGRLVGGTLVGAIAALCATLSPLLQLYFVQARTEALLAFISTLALLVALVSARHFRAHGTIPAVGWSVGTLLGLALATKLTAGLALVGVCVYGLIAGIGRWRSARPEAVRMLAWMFVTGITASIVWVAVNPFLWPNPVGRTWSMLEQQQSIMLEQGVQFGNPVYGNLLERVVLVISRSFVENSTPAFDAGRPPGSEPLVRRTFSDLPDPFGVSLELVLAAFGFAALTLQVVRGWLAGERHGAASLLLWWLLAYLLGIASNLSLDWPRYYVPTAFYGTLLIGIGVRWLAVAVGQIWNGRNRVGLAPPAPQPGAVG